MGELPQQLFRCGWRTQKARLTVVTIIRFFGVGVLCCALLIISGYLQCIIQWDIFNEGDCVGVFDNVSAVIAWAKEYDSSRLIDTNSGGPANNLHIGDVNDVHNYPYPSDPQPSATQYAMQGEYGGIGAFVHGHEW